MKRTNLHHLLLVTGVICIAFVPLKASSQDSYSYQPAGARTKAMYASTNSAGKVNLFDALKALSKQKSVFFMFSDNSFGNKQVLAPSNFKGDVDAILQEMLDATGVTFKKVNAKTYVILADQSGDALSDKLTAKVRANPEMGKPSFQINFEIITGRVVNAKGEPVPAVSISVKDKKVGTSTDNNGNFSIQANRGDILIVTSVGYQRLEVTVGAENRITIELLENTTELNAVVVTALGIKKERRSLGYSVTEVKGNELTEAREINLTNSLVGKVPGLNVSSVAGGPGASSNVIIRGISSLGSSNQPLYVINGVPMESEPNGQEGTQWDNGVDRGDAIGNINPDDIETISVLKGAAASALYGYRAKAGVILITTKSAKTDGIDFNSNYVFESIVNPTDWQYVYGQGANNIKPTSQTSAFQSGQSSWGGKLDGSNAIQFDGVERPYVAQKNNLENFYRTGGTFTNTLALSKVFTGGAIRLSANNVSNQAVIPNSGLDRQSFDLSANFNLIKRLRIDVRSNYILEQAKNRPFLSDGPGNSNYNVMFLPTSVDVNVLKKTVNEDGSEYSYSGNTFATNPWFAARKFINNTNRDRLISSINLRYNFDNGFFLQARAGRDAYTDMYKGVVPTGTAYRKNGSISEQQTKFADLNVDGLAGKTFDFTDFSLSPSIGASYRKTDVHTYTNGGSNFAVPFVYNVLNAINKSVDYWPSEQEVHSVYGVLEFDYKSFLYLTGTVRSDWFSTLATPGVDNKLNVVYPSVSGSFVFSEFMQNNWLDFGKLRAGYAVVGAATSPYQTQLSYTFMSSTLNGLPLGSISNSVVPNKGLKPSKATEIEFGTEMRLANNRLGVDLTWYHKKSEDEIIPAPASNASGYNGAILNIGELQNQGFEALVSYKIFKSEKFSWTSSINGSVNHNKVLSLAAGQSQLPGGTSRSGVGFTASIVGKAANQIMAYDYKYDDAGKMMLNSNGIPDRGDLIPLGSAYHKWIGGWNNEFSIGAFNVSFLIDGKFGGKIFSATDYYGNYFGLHKATLENREGNFGTAANPINAATYYSTLADNVSSLFVNDASFIKFRQFTIGYNIPVKSLNNVIKSAGISLVGRDLFTLMKRTDNIDPEANFSSTAAGLTSGLELGGVPPVRSIGVNLNVKF